MNQMRRQDRGLGKTAAGGSGGSFASHERAQAAAPKLGVTDGALHPHPGDETTREEWDAAVNFTGRDAEIRMLWDSEEADDRKRAEELSAELVRDTLKWRYEGADHVIIHELDGENRMLGEVRAADGSVIAYDADTYDQEDGVEYGNATMVNVADPGFNDAIWPHIDALPRIGPNAPTRTNGQHSAVDSFQFELDVRESSAKRAIQTRGRSPVGEG